MFYMILPATVVVFAIRNQNSLRKYKKLPIPAIEIDLKRKVAYLQGMPRHARRTAPCAEPWRQRGFPMFSVVPYGLRHDNPIFNSVSYRYLMIVSNWRRIYFIHSFIMMALVIAEIYLLGAYAGETWMIFGDIIPHTIGFFPVFLHLSRFLVPLPSAIESYWAWMRCDEPKKPLVSWAQSTWDIQLVETSILLINNTLW